ncbi:MAG: gliding motility lipoprotein GldD [Paludibacter sp.]
MRHFIIISLTFLLTACSQNYTPKPYGYFRVYLPAHEYVQMNQEMPFRFEYSKVATISKRSEPHEKYWFDLQYPQFNATVHVSYKSVNGNFRNLTEDARRFVYKHSIKADNITESAFSNSIKNVHGILYDLKGNTASNLQFTLTDSTHHFLRGALYFNNVPNKDSIAPIADYIRTDMVRLMESFEWKK